MEELRELKERLERERPQPWEAMPDIGLYMDQIISYMPRQLIHYGESEALTSAMVNNYIKDGMLPRAEGKRYSRTHLAYLTAICALKQVLSVRDASLLIQAGTEGKDAQTVYAHFCQALDTALTEAAGQLDLEVGAAQLPQLALALALRSYADRLACERILDIMAAHLPQEPRAERSGRRSKKETVKAEDKGDGARG